VQPGLLFNPFGLALFMLLLMAFLIGPPIAWAQSQPLPEIVVAVKPSGMIAMQPSSVTTVGFRTEPVTFEVQIQDATGQPVADDYFGPNTYFVVDVLLTDMSSGFIFSGPNSMVTVNGIARFEAAARFMASELSIMNPIPKERKNPAAPLLREVISPLDSFYYGSVSTLGKHPPRLR
jgi:hypothetical protein